MNQVFGAIRKLLCICVLVTPISSYSQIPNVRVNQDAGGAFREQNETSIAVNPLDPNNLVAGSNYLEIEPPIANYRVAFYRSVNGGLSWTEGLLATGGFYDKSADPAVAFDHGGTVWFSHLSKDDDNGLFARDNGVFINRSTDGGATWLSSPIVVAQHGNGNGTGEQSIREDQPHVACDQNQASAYVNSVYLSWVRGFISAPSQVFFSRRDPETGQFSQGAQISQTGNVRKPVPAVGPQGVLYVGWFNSGDNTIKIAKSTSSGTSFGSEQTIAADIIDDNEIKGHLKAFTYPSIAIDNSGGVYNGYVYVAWGSRQSTTNSPEIYLTVSTNGGSTWRSPVRVNGSATNDQWFPWLAVSNGIVYVIYYDSRSDPNNLLTDVYVALSSDGGATFSPEYEQKVNSVTFSPPGGSDAFMGDYNAIVSTPAYTYPFWTDRRSGVDQDVYVAVIKHGENVLVDQRLSTNQRIGTIGRWDGSTFLSIAPGTTIPFAYDAITILRSDQNIVQNEKYNKWNDDPVVVNHHQFTIVADLNQLTSHFKPTHTGVVIKTDLLDAPGTTGDTIKFKDPWLIDVTDPYGPRNQGSTAPHIGRSSPFYPNYSTSYSGVTYKGVFQNENQTFDPTKPIYSAEAPQPNIIANFTSYFNKWSGQGVVFQDSFALTTPLVFQYGDATVLAKYKAHLGSSSTSATGPTSQRKVIRGHNGYYHMAYESANEIWYTRSTDGGYNWDPEKRISSGDPAWFNRSPSVAAIGVPNPPTAPLVLVVWEVYAPNGSSHYVESRLVDGQTGSLFDEITISDEGLSGNYSMMPVAGYSNNSCW